MPEGDILRRTARTMSTALDGAEVVAAELRWPSVAGVDLVGRTILSTHSYGKHLFTRFDDGRTVHSHLRMEGSWALEPTVHPDTGDPAARGWGRSAPFTRRNGSFVRAVISTERWTAIGHRLGMLDVVPTREEHTLIAHLGPDVLSENFPTVGLHEALRRFVDKGPTPVAEVLLDQTVQAGLGTIFMAESLFVRRLWPWTPASEVVDPASLLMTARALLEKSVAAQAPVGPGTEGTWFDRAVHGRRGRPCVRCGAPVARGEAGTPPMERPVFYCPRCQKPAVSAGG
ncbi:MAG: glycosylase [Actinotalea sp.]|nr:glycosylase [Actinotalea sp.]